MISKKIINKITKEIVAACNPKLVVLFGSYGRGKPKEDSDLDIFVVANIPGKPSDRIRYINRAIAEEGFGIDIVVRTPKEFQRALKGRNWFIQEIVEEGKTLYAR
ncbi:MAG: nucleotidyltransferase domain-containing protein [Bacteroidota bacterium]|nr:nucleotidyltransferase domain-containing protein [Bacteroidota bacterium]MBU1423787.1 nucleotidyltransferase domain-containing protein [Bacteroidota bacterium]MDI6779074.1 nucleotidyltransferase domain-containing protein [Bacteroidota bacterium]